MISKSKQSKKEKMTIDKLAQITAKGFLELEERIDVKIDGLRKEVKDEMNGLRTEMMGEMNGLKERVTEGVDKMLTIADGIAKQFSDWKQESIIQVGTEARQNDKLDNHEIRIGKLEDITL